MSKVIDAEAVCESLCELFEDPAKWTFDSKGLGNALKPIYLRARDVARPPVVATGQPKTAHQFARELLLGPDHRIVVETPVFDSPGEVVANPVMAATDNVQGVDCVVVRPDR